MDRQLSSPQKNVSAADGSLHKRCGNYWHLNYMAASWPVQIKTTDRSSRNLESTPWQDLSGHQMPEGASICKKCMVYLPKTEGYGELLFTSFVKGKGRDFMPQQPVSGAMGRGPDSPHPPPGK